VAQGLFLHKQPALNIIIIIIIMIIIIIQFSLIKALAQQGRDQQRN